MSKLWVLLFKDEEWLKDLILHRLDIDGKMTYSYRDKLAKEIVKFLNERNEVKNLFCEKGKNEKENRA